MRLVSDRERERERENERIGREGGREYEDVFSSPLFGVREQAAGGLVAVRC